MVAKHFLRRTPRFDRFVFEARERIHVCGEAERGAKREGERETESVALALGGSGVKRGFVCRHSNFQLHMQGEGVKRPRESIPSADP